MVPRVDATTSRIPRVHYPTTFNHVRTFRTFAPRRAFRAFTHFHVQFVRSGSIRVDSTFARLRALPFAAWAARRAPRCCCALAGWARRALHAPRRLYARTAHFPRALFSARAPRAGISARRRAALETFPHRICTPRLRLRARARRALRAAAAGRALALHHHAPRHHAFRGAHFTRALRAPYHHAAHDARLRAHFALRRALFRVLRRRATTCHCRATQHAAALRATRTTRAHTTPTPTAHTAAHHAHTFHLFPPHSFLPTCRLLVPTHTRPCRSHDGLITCPRFVPRCRAQIGLD